MNNVFFQKIITFLKKYGIFIAPVFLFLTFMFLLIFSYTKGSQSSHLISPPQTQTGTGNENSQVEVSPRSGDIDEDGGIEDDEKTLTAWSGSSFSDSDVSGLNATKTTLPDGSTEYSYDSGVPNRPDVIIVKNGINIFQSTPFTDTPLTDNTNYYGEPDYTETGSQFWGASAVTYIYLSKGIAIVGDPTTN